MKTEAFIVYCTVPDPRAGRTIAETLVKEGLCACVNRVPGVTSHYIYGETYCEAAEELLLIKTTAEAFERLKTRIEALHPYDTPEILATGVIGGNEGYLAWVRERVK